MAKFLVLTYGSLRQGEYNHDRFKSVHGKGYEYKRTMVLDGFDLYSLGPYPGIKEGKNKLEVDLFECSEDCYRSIRGMELGAGYSEKTISLPEGESVIYMYEGSVNPNELVVDGNWKNRNNK